MDEVLSKKIPMTVICRSVDIDAPNVTTDEARAMERAMDYLWIMAIGSWQSSREGQSWILPACATEAGGSPCESTGWIPIRCL